MPEYSIAVILALSLVLALDYFIVKTKLILKKKWWIFIAVLLALQTIVDNYLNGRWWLDSYIIGPYPNQYFSGVKVFETPLENYGFGIALIWLSAALLEYFEAKKNLKQSN